MGKDKKNISFYKKGFSIIEVLLASFVLVIGIVAVIKLVSQSMVQSIDSRNAIIASELAQEGIELVRNLRDNNWIKGNPSFDANSFPVSSPADCRIDMNSSFLNCAAGGEKLYRNSDNFYVHNNSGATPSIFQRKINVTYNNNITKDSATIISTVIWGASFPAAGACNIGNKCVSAQDILTKWGQ